MKNRPVPGTKRSALAVWSLVLGLFAILLGIYLGFFAAIAAGNCGHQALARLKQGGGHLTGRGLAIAGLVLGYFEIFWAVVWFIIIGFGFSHR